MKTTIACLIALLLLVPVQFASCATHDFWNTTPDDEQYRLGTQALNHHDYEAAIVQMGRVIAAKSSRTEAAYYWKAYAQLRLHHSQDALRTLASLKRNFPGSSWLNDAAALEEEAKQQAGQIVPPETVGNEELKILAINGMMHADPARATPLALGVIRNPANNSKLKERALFVLARSSAPEAQQTLERLATGENANPDLQVRALQYLSLTNNTNKNPLFSEAYRHSLNEAVKHAALQAMFLRKDENGLLNIAQTEQSLALQQQAIQFLGELGADTTLQKLYGSQLNLESKKRILAAFGPKGATALQTIIRSETNPVLKTLAVEKLSVLKAPVKSTEH
jgi:hypothetical protein